MASIVLTDEQKRDAYQNERLDGYNVYIDTPFIDADGRQYYPVYVLDDSSNVIKYIVTETSTYTDYGDIENSTKADIFHLF